jgi:hypothetical protein
MGDKQEKTVLVDTGKFDGLLRKMLDAPPLPMADVKVANPKPKKKKRK